MRGKKLKYEKSSFTFKESDKDLNLMTREKKR